MVAFKKEELEALEAQHGLGEDGLTYQLRCSRMAAVLKGDDWSQPDAADAPRRSLDKPQRRFRTLTPESPLYGKRLLICPLMASDKNRNVYYDEVVGHDIKVSEVQAGELLYGAPEDVDRMVGDYKIVREDKSRPVIAKTTLPKIGTELSWMPGRELVPVVRGNDGQRGYIWSLPPHVRYFEDTAIQIYGLKTLIQTIYPELLPKFSGKPVMMYIDGLTLAASIPQTDAILKEHRRKELQDAQLGLV